MRFKAKSSAWRLTLVKTLSAKVSVFQDKVSGLDETSLHSILSNNVGQLLGTK